MKPVSEKKAVLAITTLGAFLAPFMGSAVNVALPRIAAEYSLDAVTLSWFAMSYMLAAAAFLLPAGGLADRHGRRRVFSIGLALYAAASAGVCAAGSIGILLAFRVVQGLGGAMLFGTSAAILMSVFPAGDRGRVLGWNVAAVYAGLTLGPVIGGLLTARFGWRSLFLVNAGLAAAAWLALASGVRSEWKHPQDGPFDKAGALLSMISLTVLMIGFSKLPSALGTTCACLGLAGIAGFVVLETRSPHPLLDMNLFRRNRVFAFSNLAALMHYAATAAVAFLLSLYLQTVKGMEPGAAGLVLAAQPLVMAVLSPVTGILSDRIAPRTLASLGMAVSTLGLLLLSTAGRDTPVGFIVACLLVLGLGFAFFSSPNTNAVMGSVEPRRVGLASAILGTMRLTGQMGSMGFAVLLISVFVGSRSLSQESIPAFLSAQRTAFAVCAGLCFTGIFASLARGKNKGLKGL
jgi:EmrB/QacA subfamily drug resistance transporter